jgi:adenine deaminase
MSDLKLLVEKLPKAELHLHIEGSLEPELMFKLANRNGLTLPYSSVEEIRQAYNFTQLQDFLDIYYAGMSVLLTEADFYDLTMAYLTKCHQQNIRHVEIFFDPQGHTDRGVDFETVIHGINRALTAGFSKWGISYKTIMCFLRHLTEQQAIETLNQARPYLDLIDGVGLDSSEVGNPPSKFQQVFAQAAALGLKKVAHAGEEGPPEYVKQALELLKVDRIDHGNRAMESSALIDQLKQQQIALTVCPLSNKKLCVVKDLEDHPLPEMLKNGLLVTINSDDPSYFGGYLNENFDAIIQALNLTEQQVIQLVKNSFIASFLDDSEKQKHLAAIDSLIQ